MAGKIKLRQLALVTDLDGTLLDQRTYSYEQSLPAVRRLKAHKIPIVLCSTKTSAEMIELWRELDLHDPFICESGGALYMPREYLQEALPEVVEVGPFGVLPLGKDVLRLRALLAHASCQSGVKIRSFGQMTIDEIAELTGLAPDQAFRAWQRQYDEPFLAEARAAEKLSARLRDAGLTVTRGDRFYHLTGGHSKRDAVLRWLELHRRWYGETYSVGLGNSANDGPMLAAVDRPILVRNPDGRWDSTVMEQLPHVEKTAGVGPEGWGEAVERILREAEP